MKEGPAEGVTEEVFVPTSEQKPARREESSLADDILEFNRDALAVVKGLNFSLGEEKKVELRFSKKGEVDCEIVFKPIYEKWVEDKKGVVEAKAEEMEPAVKTFPTDDAGILDEYDVCIEFSSNQRLADTPELGLLTKVTVAKRESDNDKPEPVLDAFVSLRDGVRTGRGQFDSYSRPKLTEEEELTFLEVADLMRAVKGSLQVQSKEGNTVRDR